MKHLVEEQKKSIIESFQYPFSDELIFQIVDLFPMPIEIFAPDGTTIGLLCGITTGIVQEYSDIFGALELMTREYRPQQ